MRTQLEPQRNKSTNASIPLGAVRIAIAGIFLALTAVTHAQITTFYVSEGAAGLVAKVSASGTASTLANPGGNVQGITTDSAGNVLAAVGSSIYQITPAGAVSLFASYANPIRGLAMSSEGLLYGVSGAGGPSGGANVGVFNANGTFTPVTLTTSPFAPFYPSNGLKFDEAGNLFVTNSGNGGTFGESVLKLVPNGNNWSISAFASYTAGTFQPFDVTTDLLGNVFVSSGLGTGGPIVKYDSTGAIDTNFTLSGTPEGTVFRGLTFANEKLYAVSLGKYNMYEINPLTGAATVFNTNFLPDYRNTYITSYTTVPEPSHIALLVFGSLYLMGGRRLHGLAKARKACPATGSEVL